MTRVLWVGVLVLATALPASTPSWEDVQRKILEFYVPFDAFSRQAFGCPEKGEFTALDCRKAYVKIDYKNFEKSRKAAMKLFDLVERTDD